MNINKIKNEISLYLNKTVILTVDIGRKRKEKISGIINQLYPYIFTVKVGDEIKSFSYSDVLIGTVSIKLL